ncbi:tetratricopeptide repeat protein [Rubripirellula sp.]|nr:tetratricopeptide repeat protein [Rubripirellula sp.]MDB4338899.1 tetratricopeptide repeat protein [Rubripirellula sp.]
MSNERRHELQQNDLAIWLAKINKTLEPYSKQISILVALLIVGFIAYGFLESEELAKRSDATLQLIQATNRSDAEVLSTVSEDYSETKAGSWARLYQGQQYLSDGLEAIFTDRDNAEALLAEAQETLKSAVASSTETLLVSRAHYGLGQAAEALGDIDDAKDHYNNVVELNESDAMVERANERISALEQPDTEAFLNWFGSDDFVGIDPTAPPPLPTGNTLPEIPELSLPPTNLGGEGATKDLTGGIELPIVSESAEDEADGDVEPTEETSEESPQAAIEPGAETEPADEPESSDETAPDPQDNTSPESSPTE